MIPIGLTLIVRHNVAIWDPRLQLMFAGLSMSLEQSALLALPSEVRQLIYSFVVAESRLSILPLSDPEWSLQPSDNHRLPDLCFVSRQLYREVANHFYSCAILELAPPGKGSTYFDIINEGSTIGYGYLALKNLFLYHRADHLFAIRRAHLFSNQRQVINGECYEGTLQWLVQNTGVVDVLVSRRARTRIGGKAGFDLDLWRKQFREPSNSNLRIVRVWTRGERTPWEHDQIRRLSYQPATSSLKAVQTYFFSGCQCSNIQLDPRWFTRSGDQEVLRSLDPAITSIDAFMSQTLAGQELRDYKQGVRHFDPRRAHLRAWLYQILLVSDLDNPQR